MYHLVNLLRLSPAVSDIEIIALADEEDIQFIYLKAELKDGSFLFVRELSAADGSKYSYHWQSRTGKLICRWDNAPHHKKIATFPHHRHLGQNPKINPSEETNLEEVMLIIERKLSPKNFRKKP